MTVKRGTIMADYIAVLHEGPDNQIGVQFPDFPGCITVGDNLEDARLKAREALLLHVRGMKEDGDALPAPQSLDLIKANPDYAGADAFLVVTVPDQKIRRINITLPESDLNAIDDYARRKHQTRSSFILQAARRAMGLVDKPV